jgi:GNAT superfamily N-acetyltransferase
VSTSAAPTADSTTTRPDAEPDAVAGAGTADPDAAVGLDDGTMPRRRLRRSSDRGVGGDRGGSAGRSLVCIRELGAGDGDVVDEIFAGLSPRSRFLRFHGPVVELSAATRRSLTALDGRTHVALAAFTEGRPIGIVRIIDLGDGRGELAIEVVDRWQGCAVGTQLLQAARDRAAELGYFELVGEMLAVNAAAHAALRRVFRVTRVRRDGSELTITMAVDGGSAPASPVEGLVA